MGYYDKIGAKRYEAVLAAVQQREDLEISEAEFYEEVLHIINGGRD